MYEDSKKIIKFLQSPVHYQTEEEKLFLETTFLQNNKVIENQNQIYNDNIQYFLFHERPDLIIIGKTVLSIEHFEVDASLHTKKGSKYKHIYNEKFFFNQQNQITNELLHTESVTQLTRIQTDLKYEYLKENLKKIIDSHYQNIDEYEEEIRKIKYCETKKIEHLFCVDYQIIFPPFFQENNRNISFLPHNDIEIIEYLKDKKKLTGVLFCNEQNNTETDVSIIITKNGNLENYKINETNIFDISMKKYIDLSNPTVASVSFTVPRN